jgi:hypothetical protein
MGFAARQRHEAAFDPRKQRWRDGAEIGSLIGDRPQIQLRPDEMVDLAQHDPGARSVKPQPQLHRAQLSIAATGSAGGM